MEIALLFPGQVKAMLGAETWNCEIHGQPRLQFTYQACTALVHARIMSVLWILSLLYYGNRLKSG